jgi:ATP/maltotriose-dependent transcriptional regulator MalT
MRREVEWYKGRPDEGDVRWVQARAAAHGGRLTQARELYAQAIALARRNGLEESAAHTLLDQAATEALFGNAREARERAAEGLTRGRGPFAPLQAARAFALSGAGEKAQPLIDETARRFPSHTLIQELELPVLRAVLELDRGNAARAAQLVEPAARYELGFRSPYYVLYVRGLAYLRSRAGAEAAAQFQKVLDHRGIDPLSPLYPLSQLGLARARALAGDAAQSRRAYQDFLALWKDADADLPVLRDARAEYAKLKDR